MFARVIPLVGDDDAGRILAQRQSDLAVEVARAAVSSVGKSVSSASAALRRPDGSGARHDDAGVEIDRPRAPACKLSDASFRPSSWRILASGSVGLFQSAFDSVLPLRLRVEARQVLGRRRLNPALLRAIRVSIAR